MKSAPNQDLVIVFDDFISHPSGRTILGGEVVSGPHARFTTPFSQRTSSRWIA